MAISRILLSDLKAGRCSNKVEMRLLDPGKPVMLCLLILCSIYHLSMVSCTLSRVTTPGGLKILDASSEKSPTESVTNIVYREIFAALATSVSNANQNTTPHIDGINNQI
ncbi:unnamed protein product, partial [Brassica oleracea]